jgi:uncharacterized membrane protein (DUF485 family)
MSRKWGEQRPDIKPAIDEAANYEAMQKQRRKIERALTIFLASIIVGSLLLIFSYWH